MRSTDDQLQEIMKRADGVKERKASQKAALSYGLSSCVCIILLVFTSFRLNDLSAKGMSKASGHYGSLLLNTSYMGYVVIGVLAFLLGISVALLCMSLKRAGKWRRTHS